MPFQSIPSSLVTTKPRVAALEQSSAVSATYYTVLDISGSGKLTYCGMNIYSATSIAYLNIRITIDGVTQNLDAPNPATVGYVPSSGTSATKFDYLADISFFNSLKVEIMQDSGSPLTIYGIVYYSLI